MAAPPPRRPRRRPRRGSLERPVNARTYRGTWLLVGLPLLVAAFSVSRVNALPAPALPATFDAPTARLLASDLATRFPGRAPGSPAASEAADWVAERFREYGFRPLRQRFEADVAGLGRRRLTNVLAVVPGRSDSTIVVSAHRDGLAGAQGANDNASGTATLLELARTYARAGAEERAVVPRHRLVFLSTDAGAYGGHGAAFFAETTAFADAIVAVVNLDSLAGRGPPRLVLAGEAPRAPPPVLLATSAQRILEETRTVARRPSALEQLVDLGFPFSLYEQAPFLARGIPAVTLTSGSEKPVGGVFDSPEALDRARFARLGRTAQQLLVSLDDGLEQRAGTAALVFFGERSVPGWAVELVLIASILPFLAATVDLFARCRRRRVALMPALRGYAARLTFWLIAGALFAAFALLGAWASGEPRPVAPATGAADPPAAALAVYAALVALVWLVARDPLVPRRAVTREEELAGYTAALLVLGVVALIVVAVNAFALVFLLPCLHAWVWLPQVHSRGAWARLAVLVAGMSGAALLLWSFATRVGLGLDAPWYLVALAGLGYVELPLLLLGIAWLAAAGQLGALAGGRYAPYPRRAERPPRGPVRQLVRRAVRARRRREEPRLRALG
ncbi:MAG: M28 family peptidase [Thermoleophilia bacterium]|nr:M28 family peptidase [Thermoleophilia bacterium]